MHIVRSRLRARRIHLVPLWAVVGAALLSQSTGCSSRTVIPVGRAPADLLDQYCNTGRLDFADVARPIRINKSSLSRSFGGKRIPEVGIKYGTTYEVPIGSVVSEAMRRAAGQLVDEVKFEADLEACTIDFDITEFTWCANEKEADEVCTLGCTIRFLDHEGHNVYLSRSRFRAEHASAFDGKDMPRSIWECAVEIACRAIDKMSQERGVFEALRR